MRKQNARPRNLTRNLPCHRGLGEVVPGLVEDVLESLRVGDPERVFLVVPGHDVGGWCRLRTIIDTHAQASFDPPDIPVLLQTLGLPISDLELMIHLLGVP